MEHQELTGFRQVSKDEFWKWVMGTTRNVHPSCDGRFKSEEGVCSIWHDLRAGEVVGRSYGKEGRYYLRQDIKVSQ